MTPASKKAPMDKIASVKAIVDYIKAHPGADIELDDLRAVVAKSAIVYGFRPIGPQGIAATMCLIYRRSPLYAKLAPEGIVKVRPGVYCYYTPQPEPNAQVDPIIREVLNGHCRAVALAAFVANEAKS